MRYRNHKSLLAGAVIVAICAANFATSARAEITAIWANDGGDKVLREERRAAAGSVINSVWNGKEIKVFGARNEIVSFNLVIESSSGAREVRTSLAELAGPAGAKIASRTASGDGVFNYVDRNIELFYVRYLPIRGLSRLSYDSYYDERHVPSKMRRPFNVDSATNLTTARGDWRARPGADKYFPEIAVPMELQAKFDILPDSNQSVWVDIHIPKGTSAGIYAGSLVIESAGAADIRVPVGLEVLNFELPDESTAKTMVPLSAYDLSERFVGKRFIHAGDADFGRMQIVRERFFQAARRHRITLVGGEFDGESEGVRPPVAPFQRENLSGSLFTKSRGYAGPGVDQAADLFVIGLYGSAPWKNSTESIVHERMNEWEAYLEKDFPRTERIVYDVDEPELSKPAVVAELNSRLDKYKSNAGIGSRLRIFTTAPLAQAKVVVPRFDVIASWYASAHTQSFDQAYRQHVNGTRAYWQYNGKRPASGSFATEDDGASLRMIPWAQSKKGVARHFFWLANYYFDYQVRGKHNDLFNSALTFGADSQFDPNAGRTGFNYSNGDGVLMYPGVDQVFPADSYGAAGPLVSLRMKHWRRGIQDVEYVALARKASAQRTAVIVNRMVPKVLWEIGVTDPNDPSWVRSDISWSINPDDWEKARRELADIVLNTPTAARPRAPSNLTVR
jgi:hypothetical protein